MSQRLKRSVVALLLLVLGAAPFGSFAANIVHGAVMDTGNVFSWQIALLNDSGSTDDVTRVVLDSRTAAGSTEFYWASVGVTPPDLTVSGVGGQELALDFGTPLTPGNFLLLTVVPNDIPDLPDPIANSAMLGVEATFTFGDGSTWSGVFADVPPVPGDPLPDALYTLQPLQQSSVPLPGTVVLLLAGLMGLAITRARKACEAA